MVQFQLDPQLTVAILAGLLTLASVVAWALLGRNVRSVYKAVALMVCWALFTGAIIKSGAGTDTWTIDTTSKAGRVTLYDSAGRQTSLQSKQTFGISSTFTPAATPTDLVIIEGSATKTVRLLSVVIGTQTTAAGSEEFRLIKRSTADTTGTFVSAGTAVPFDSANVAATVNRVGHFTANPGALGTSLGNINILRQASPVLLPATLAGIREVPEVEMVPPMGASLLDQPITLRGVAETLAVNFNGAALVAGQIHTYRIMWIEE